MVSTPMDRNPPRRAPTTQVLEPTIPYGFNSDGSEPAPQGPYYTGAGTNDPLWFQLRWIGPRPAGPLLHRCWNQRSPMVSTPMDRNPPRRAPTTQVLEPTIPYGFNSDGSEPA